MGGTLVQAIVLVTDLHDARRRMESLGFTVIDGGHHPGRGTANMIVPFGEQYLELLAVVDEAEARSSPQGQPVVAALARRGPGLARWSVEPDDIEAAASSPRPSGRTPPAHSARRNGRHLALGGGRRGMERTLALCLHGLG